MRSLLLELFLLTPDIISTQKELTFDITSFIFSEFSPQESSKNAYLKFTKRNHERDESLDEKQLVAWFGGLLSKIY